jgi:hypothetical protein
VTVGSGLAEDRTAEVQVADDATWFEVEVLVNNGGQFGIVPSILGSSVSVNKDRKRVGDTNRVRKLDQDTLAKSLGDQGLGDPASGVGSGTVDLGGILSRKGTSSVGSPSSVSINNNLTSSQTGISMGSSNNEATRGVQVVDSVGVQVLFGDNNLNDVLHEVAGDLLVSDILGVLARDNNSVATDGYRDTVDQVVFASDLGLGIGADPVAGSVLADLADLGSELSGQHVSQRHQSLGLVSGVSKHDSLVTSTEIFHLGGIDGLGNIGGLFLDGNNDVACLVVKTLGWVIVTDILDGITDNLFVVDSGSGGDFSENHDHTGLAASLASNTGGFISSEASIQDSIRNLIGKLICNNKMEEGRS